MWRRVPYVLIGIRGLAGPIMVALALAFGERAGWACVGILAIGVLSDILDGVIARNTGSVTDDPRTWDSRVDLLFWLCVTGALFVIYPALVASLWPVIAILAALEATNHLISFLRFRRESSPHHLLSKLFTLGLWGFISFLFTTGAPQGWQWAILALGALSQIEAIAINLLIPEWRTDTRDWRAALQHRRARSTEAT